MCGRLKAKSRFTRKESSSCAIPCHNRVRTLPDEGVSSRSFGSKGTAHRSELSSSETAGMSPRTCKFNGARTLSPLRRSCRRSSWFMAWKSWRLIVDFIARDGRNRRSLEGVFSGERFGPVPCGDAESPVCLRDPLHEQFFRSANRVEVLLQIL
jgi:hypothetical protein